MVFATFGCQEFDDGTKYLMADYSIDCYSSTHLWMKVYGRLMLLIWPMGVPMLYLLVLGRKHKAFNRVRAIELAIEQSNADGQKLKQSAERAIERERLASSYAHTSDPESLQTSPANEEDEEDQNDEEDGRDNLARVAEIAGVSDLYDDGTALRSQAQALWEKMQPILGIEFAESDGISVRVGRVVWPTFELVPTLLTEENYHLVDLQRIAESHDRRSSVSRSSTRRRQSVSPARPLKRAASTHGPSADMKFAEGVVWHLKGASKRASAEEKSELASAEDKVVDDLVQAWGTARRQEAEEESENLSEKGRERQAAKVQEEIDSLTRTTSKSVVLVTVLEQELARMAYWAAEKKSMSVRATKRATRTSRQTAILKVDGPSAGAGKAHQKPTKPDKETAEKIAEDLLLNKDWQRMSDTRKASYLPCASRINQPLPNDVILSVDGVAVTDLDDAKQKLEKAGHASDGLARLQVLRSLEWRETNVNYVVEVTVKKKLVFTLPPFIAACVIPSARLPCCVGSRMALRWNSDATTAGAGQRSTGLQNDGEADEGGEGGRSDDLTIPGYVRALTNQYDLFLEGGDTNSMPVYGWEVRPGHEQIFPARCLIVLRTHMPETPLPHH